MRFIGMGVQTIGPVLVLGSIWWITFHTRTSFGSQSTLFCSSYFHPHSYRLALTTVTNHLDITPCMFTRVPPHGLDGCVKALAGDITTSLVTPRQGRSRKRGGHRYTTTGILLVCSNTPGSTERIRQIAARRRTGLRVYGNLTFDS